MTKQLNKYLPSQAKEILNASEKEFRRVVGGSSQSDKKKAITSIEDSIRENIMKYRKVLRTNIGTKTRQATSKEVREVILQIIQEVNEHLMALKTEKKMPSSKEIGVQEYIIDSIRDLLEDIKHVRYGGSKLKAEDIMSSSFSSDQITVVKKINVSEIESDVKILFSIKEFPIPNHIKKNLRAFTERLEELSKAKTTRFKIHRHESHLKKIFGSDTQRAKDAKDRKATYKFWKGIAGHEDDLETELDKLVVLLKKGNPSDAKADKDVAAFLKFMSDEPDLKYVYPFPKKTLGFADLNARSYQFLLNFLKLFNYDVNFRGSKSSYAGKGDSDAPSDDDDTSDSEVTGGTGQEEVVSDEPQGGEDSDELDVQTEQNIAAEAQRADRANQLTVGEDVVRDVFSNPEVSELMKDMEKEEYDPLGILVVKDDLKGLMPLYGEIDEIKDYLEEKRALLDIDEDDEEAIFETFMDDLERIHSLADSLKEFHLPIFAAENPVIREEYPELKAKAGSTGADIDRFLELFANLIQDERATMANVTALDLRGASTGGKKEEKAPPRYFKYVRGVASRKGSPRQSFKAASSANSKINAAINRVVKEMAHVFITPQMSHLDAGISLPFKNNFALRLISSTKKLDEKFKIYQAINQKFMSTGEAFIDEEAVVKLRSFTNMLAKGDAVQNFENIKSAGAKFAEALYDIAEYTEDKTKTKLNNNIKESIQKDVAAILGSIRSISNVRRDEYFMNNTWGNKIGILDEYKKSKKDGIEDISVLRVILDLLESKHGESAIPDKNERQKLLDDLREIKKSEVSEKILSVHDSIRLLKQKPVFYGKKKINNFDHIGDMITKMEREYNLDISASEITGVVNELDSFDSISKSYGISTEHVYVIKANFR